MKLSDFFNWKKAPPPPPQAATPAPPPSLAGLDIKFNDSKTEAEMLPRIKAMLDNGAAIDEPIGKNKDTILHIVCERGWLDAAKMLFEYGAPIEARNDQGETPFMSACGGRNPALMEYLAAKNADVQAVDNNNHNGSYHYIMNNYFMYKYDTPELQARDKQGLKFLQDQGLTMDNIVNIYAYMPENHSYSRHHLAALLPEVLSALAFEKAVEDKDYETVQRRLNTGTDPDIGATFGGRAALAIAAAADDTDMMRRLLRARANVDRWSSMETALHAAAISGARAAFTLLVSAGADTDKLYTYDRYPDTTITEVAAMCKTDTGMKSFVEQTLAGKDALVAEFQANKAQFLKPEFDDTVILQHNIQVRKPVKMMLRTPKNTA